MNGADHDRNDLADANRSRTILGMRVIWDAEIEMDDGIILRADIFLPVQDGEYPVIMAQGPYGKGLSFQEGYKSSWDRMVAAYPEIEQGSTSSFQVWEFVDPEKWVPDGYVCIRIDGRGSGRSAGKLDLLSRRETKDLYDCIEWAGEQPWSNGKVGLNGISYLAINQWLVAELQPPHLAAICVWEGAADWYRDWSRHGGILSQFDEVWYDGQVASQQHGVGERGMRSPFNGELIAGPETLAPDVLEENRVNCYQEELKLPLDGAFYHERTADHSKIITPLLSAANWGGMGCHTRGNFEGYLAAGSTQKWLEVHGNTHFAPFYRNAGIIYNGPADPGFDITRVDIDHDRVNTYSFGARWRPTQQLLFYVRAASGFRPGGGRTLPPAAEAIGLSPVYQPDHVWSYEAGLKASALDNKLSVDLDAFWIDWKNIQNLQLIEDIFLSGNAGRARSRGVEADVQLVPIHGLNLTGSFAYTDAVYTQGNEAAGVAAGDELNAIAKYTASLKGEYGADITDRWHGFIGGDVQYRSSELDVVNVRMPPYTLFGLHAGVEHASLRANVFVTNLTDKRDLGEHHGQRGLCRRTATNNRHIFYPEMVNGFSILTAMCDQRP